MNAAIRAVVRMLLGGLQRCCAMSPGPSHARPAINIGFPRIGVQRELKSATERVHRLLSQ